MEKNLRYGLLLQIYGKLLTDRQRDIIGSYYDYDLSLAEIADNSGISRQGGRDNIKRAEAILYDVEEKLGIAKRFLKIQNKLKDIDDIIIEIEKSPDVRILSDNIKRKINKILTIIGEINLENS